MKPVTAAPDRRHRHVWQRLFKTVDVPVVDGVATLPDGRAVASGSNVVRVPVPVAGQCLRCGKTQDETRSRKGRTVRSYGNRAELAVARRYGGEKIGHHGGPVDVRGVEFDSQVKTHRRLPPAEWRKAFAAMPGTRIPRLLLRFVGTGVAPEDYIVIRGADWLAWFGRDEGAGGAGEGGAG